MASLFDKLWHVQKVVLLVLFALGMACGTEELVREPDWTVDEARTALYSDLVDMLAADGSSKAALAVATGAHVHTWDAKYKGEGWWLVRGDGLGWENDRFSAGTWRVSEKTGHAIAFSPNAKRYLSAMGTFLILYE